MVRTDYNFNNNMNYNNGYNYYGGGQNNYGNPAFPPPAYPLQPQPIQQHQQQQQPQRQQGQGQNTIVNYGNPYANLQAPPHGANPYNYGGTQTFEDIKAKFKYDRQLFEDQIFPAADSSLHVPGGIRPNQKIHWRRPGELIRNPKFFADGVSRFDVIQGELGNCWFIAAVANLTSHQNYFYQVVPRDNSFNPGEYCGAFHFRFWQYGDWIDIVVDDRLPCNSRGEILYLHSEDKSEFWSALLEKAYAKLHGSYGSLAGGSPSEAMQDFTGGIVELIEVKETTNLFNILRKAFSRQAMMTCALANAKSGYREEKTATGLVRGHAYSITSVQEIRVSGSRYQSSTGFAQLVRVRNPWGDYFEWNGAWSDRSREWDMVDASVKASLEWSKKNDGEFWMSIHDLQRQFDHIEICHLGPDPIDSHLAQNTQEWDKTVIRGSWNRGSTAGGCINHHDTYARNPQYIFNFEASDQDGDGNKCTVIVSLIQKEGSRNDRKKFGGNDQTRHIGFRVYPIPRRYAGGRQFDSDFFRENCRASHSSGAYVDTREISGRFELPTGAFCIVPTTYNRNEEGEFLLRIFSEPQPPRRALASVPSPAASNPGIGIGIGWNLQLDDMFSNKLSLNSDSNSSSPYGNTENNYNQGIPPYPVPSAPMSVPGGPEPPAIGWVFDTIKQS